MIAPRSLTCVRGIAKSGYPPVLDAKGKFAVARPVDGAVVGVSGRSHSRVHRSADGPFENRSHNWQAGAYDTDVGFSSCPERSADVVPFFTLGIRPWNGGWNLHVISV